MRRTGLPYIVLIACFLFSAGMALAQGMHFSQYYNAPLLLNPANTALMPNSDYRVGFNFRKQWASVPVPYRTISAYGDFQAMRNKNQTNWMGLGVAFFNDVAGDGDLSLSRIEGFVAYHVEMGISSMLSVGISAASVQRKVDFNKFTFNNQWDGFSFDPTLATGESGYVAKTSFLDVSAGVNYAYFPNEDVYIKLGVGLGHLNQPKESFYNQSNQIGFRPTANFDGLFKLNASVILNPSIYYTSEKNASEIVYGTLFQVNVAGVDANATSLILGAFHRWNEAVIGTIGLQIGEMRVMSSYDFTISSLSPFNKGKGAFELGLKYEGLYGEGSRGRRSYNCPRF
jgi:type IX secretion system PorP/SprF family membrane protein